ncbi:NAD(P)/FAD-dependent oxidoreductase [methane-oxidizing endosymbiont of Gigantopelta aegis]|uniref:NAD(P)/FAD-dependent oxidoreductase n=1 Tax=methane-oxidizing endosymbiont of Gigantopelta aegis TaxID=2794938 RepID=UPI0018DDF109|nr:NAD(P)/FAD-dependent oxidoreductase [methane-oxidizing endosymbiont of Gigantopelta aegis]
MIDRRRFLHLSGAACLASMTGCGATRLASPYSAHVVVIGGGFAGATAAKTLRLLNPHLKVTLVEANAYYMTCPTSNWVLAGIKSIRDLRFDYRALSQNYGVNMIIDRVTAVDAAQKTVILQRGDCLHYDRLIMAPGIDFVWDDIAGYDAEIAQRVPHAWQAGPQTRLLWRQLQAMPDNGLIVLLAPPNPFRCPPGPYERASLMAYYCQRYKPKAKILILDQKRSFSKQSLFIQGWRRLYGYGADNGRIEWQSITDNPVVALMPKNTLETDFGDRFTADVLNIIPRQKAGKIAQLTGLADDSGWCPVTPLSAESTRIPGIHVIGDAATYAGIPKSAFAANSEAKACAMAVVALLNDELPQAPLWMNTCFSLLSPSQAISVSMVYKLNSAQQIEKVKGAGGVSVKTDTASLQHESEFARHWYQSITRDTFS